MPRSGYTCLRRALCWLNIILWVTGCGVLAVGLWLKFAFDGYINLFPQYYHLGAEILLIIIGCITITLAFFGCCGSWYQNRCLLIIYFSCLILVFEVELFLGVIAILFRSFLGETLVTELKNGIKYHYDITSDATNGLVDIWDTIQSKLKCCGVTNATDWYNIDAWPSEKWVPDSCCINETEHCGKIFSQHSWYTKGCDEKIFMWFIERLYIVGIIGLVVAFLQLFGLISSLMLFCTVKKGRLEISEAYTENDTTSNNTTSNNITSTYSQNREMQRSVACGGCPACENVSAPLRSHIHR